MKSIQNVIFQQHLETPTFPFMWKGSSGTTWLRYHSKYDIAVHTDGTHCKLGAIPNENVSDALAWSMKLPAGSTVTLIQE